MISNCALLGTPGDRDEGRESLLRLFSFLVMFMSENPSHKKTQRFRKVPKYSSVTDLAIALYKTLYGIKVNGTFLVTTVRCL